MTTPSLEHACDPPDDQYADGPWEWICPVCGAVWERHARFWWQPSEKNPQARDL